MYDNADWTKYKMYSTLDQAKEELEFEYSANPDFKLCDYRIELFNENGGNGGVYVYSGLSIWRRSGCTPAYRDHRRSVCPYDDDEN